MNTNTTIKDLIATLAKDTGAEIYAKLCEVTSVDESARTCDAAPLDGGADVVDVLLQTSEAGLCIVPAVGSFIIVVFIDKNTAFASVIGAPAKVLIDAPETVFNGGKNGPLMVLSKLAAEVSKIQRNIENIQSAVKTAIVVPNDGGAALKAAISSVGLQKPDLSESAVGDSKIKH